jgi:hypothetical protein
MDLVWSPYGLPSPQAEYRFHPVRRWRFDYAWPDRKIAVERQGGIWMRGITGRGGAHSLPSNIIRDMEKNNAAVRLGWRVFLFTPRELEKGIAQTFMKEVFI